MCRSRDVWAILRAVKPLRIFKLAFLCIMLGLDCRLLFFPSSSVDRLPRKHVHHHTTYSAPTPQVLYTVDDVPVGASWTGNKGHVSKDVVAAFLPPPQAEAGRNKLLVCGPPPMVNAVSCGRRLFARCFPLCIALSLSSCAL